MIRMVQVHRGRDQDAISGKNDDIIMATSIARLSVTFKRVSVRSAHLVQNGTFRTIIAMTGMNQMRERVAH